MAATDAAEPECMMEDRSEQSPPSPPATPAVVATERYVVTPPIDIYETDEGLVLQADLPGVSGDSVDLNVQDNKLTLFGRVQLDLPESARVVHQEFHFADFLRSFILSDEVDHERISAKLTHGVLTVTLPRAEREKPRRIEIRTE